MISATRLIAFGLVAVFVAVVDATNARAQIQFGVPRITDADTVTINGAKIRLFGIDAPEMIQFCLDAQGKRWPCGERARDQLKKKVASKPWTCRGSDHDVYQRLLAVCHVDGEDINQWLVRSGLALSYKQYSRKYDADETAARAARAGLWDGAFIAPWDWRHRNKSTEILGTAAIPRDAQQLLLPPDAPPAAVLTQELAAAPTTTPTTAPTAAPTTTSIAKTSGNKSSAGPCKHADDRAADGSRCGKRASSERSAKAH
jgi:endonuclease YncB( thermonuclease family)